MAIGNLMNNLITEREMAQLIKVDNTPTKTINVNDMIDKRKLVAHFQPIVSIAKKNICGLEGLIRGIDIDTEEIISPLLLFSAAKHQGVEIELDRACRELVTQTYGAIHLNKKNTLLFLNINSSILDKVVGSNHLISMVRNCGVNPNDIVIEINESKVKDTVLLKEFVETYRNYGFLIALDDMGCGFSNLDRIPLVKPDIVKTDISLVRNICNDFYVKEVFRSVVSLSIKIGALVVAEGVETEDEAIQTLELGTNMLQGFYISKPQNMCNGLPESINERIKIIAERFQKVEKGKLIRDRRRYINLNDIMSTVTRRLAAVHVHDFDDELSKTVNSSDGIECAYILNGKGIQSSATVFPSSIIEIKKNLLYYPAEIGTDHSLKTYYRYLHNAKVRKYLTEPYASLASGNLCVTFAKTFQDSQNSKYILCIDFNVPGMENEAR